MFPFELQQPGGPVGSAMWMINILWTLSNLLMGVFWLVIGWRAMKAHERLPDALAASLRRPAPAAEPNV